MPARPVRRRDRRGTRGLRGGGVLAVVLAVLLLPLALTALVLGLVPDLQLWRPARLPNAPALLAAFLPYGLVAWVLILLLVLPALIRARRRFLPGLIALVAATGVLVQGSWAAPYVVGATPEVHRPMEVMSLNLLQGQADLDQVLQEAKIADIVVLVELRPEFRQRLEAAGIGRRFPNSVTERDGYVTDTGIYSRWPITSAHTIDLSTRQWVATVRTPDHGEVTVAAVHPLNPTHGSAVWAAEGSRLYRELRPYSDRPTIIAGDFNMIDRHQPMRRFLDHGFADAAQQANAGWSPTWPTRLVGLSGLPGLVGIDHVLLSDSLHADRVQTFPVDGTDHRGLRVRVG